MKKGFTLVELVATLIVLAVVGLIVFPIVNATIKNGKEKLYLSQLQEIEEAAEKWAYLNTDLLPNDGENTTLTILELKKAGLLPLDIRNPKTDELLPNDMQVVVENKNGIYSFDVNAESGTDITSEVNENSPIIVLNGNPIEYIEIGSNYQDKGVKAKDKTGNSIVDINIVYKYGDTEIGELSTLEFKTYTVVYSVSNVVNGTLYTSSITRTLVVRDTTKPELTVPEKIDITLNEASSFDLLNGVVVTDNSGENINVTTTGFDVSIGQKIVSYTACDSNNNCITKKRIINITE